MTPLIGVVCPKRKTEPFGKAFCFVGLFLAAFAAITDK